MGRGSGLGGTIVDEVVVGRVVGITGVVVGVVGGLVGLVAGLDEVVVGITGVFAVEVATPVLVGADTVGDVGSFIPGLSPQDETARPTPSASDAADTTTTAIDSLRFTPQNGHVGSPRRRCAEQRPHVSSCFAMDVPVEEIAPVRGEGLTSEARAYLT